VETDFRARSAGPRTLGAGRHDGDRYAEIGRLLITCPHRPGIVAAVSSFLFGSGANITESQQYSTDPFGGTFFLRIEFHLPALAERFGDLARSFGELAGRFSMRWQMTRAGELKRVAITVSRAGHALQEILWRSHWGELRAGIRMVISYHRDAEEAAADPGQQAGDRGVKLIGATAHYVTSELDAGPIIEQDIVRVGHRCSADGLRQLGRHVERAVLARAVNWHLADRLIVHQNKTIAFT